MTRTGFPWAEVATDGSSVIGKHDGTGGEVSIGTVTSQLLYEIGAPAYLGPDVTARFDTIELDQLTPDRVGVRGVRGEPPPPALKVAMNELGGYRNDIGVALTGLDIEAKAQLVDDAFWEACPFKPSDFASVTTRVVRTDKADPATNEEAVAVWRLTLKDPDERKVGRAVSNAMVELGLATIPGFFGVGGGPREGRPYGVYRPALVPAELVPQHVVVRGGERTVVDSVAPPSAPVQVTPAPGPNAAPPGGDTVAAPLGRVVGARSGDKGGNANLGVFARSDGGWAWLDGFLTTDKLRELLPETVGLDVERHPLPALRSLNFVIHGLLQEGVAASTRQDAQAKSLGEWLRARVVEVPTALLPEA
jgi:Acyclic terpene utilisation family protein AtuA